MRKVRIDVSSEENSTTAAYHAIDGNPWTRWASAAGAPQWVEVDLGTVKTVSSIGISWESMAADYNLLVSVDRKTWKQVRSVAGVERDPAKLYDETVLKPARKVRYFRIHCLKLVRNWNVFSIFQLSVNGQKLIVEPPRGRYEAPDAPFRNRRLSPVKRARDLVARLTLEELVDLTGGYSMFFVWPLKRFGLPAISFADASMGVRCNDAAPTNRCVSFPALMGLAATWNPDLAKEYGRSLGEECRGLGVHTLLGPGVNIYRTSRCGRNFEYMGEDPFLTSRLAVPYIQGLQSNEVISCIKHFCCNNNEWIRHDVNVQVDDRALREIYLPSFKAAIDEAGVMAVMTAYNYWRGEKASQNKDLIAGLLRKELGFKNLIMSDWDAVWNGEKVLASGQDLVMPANGMVRRYVEEHPGRRTRIVKDLRRMALSILTAMFRMGFYDRPQRKPVPAARQKAHEAVALETARQAVTLLQNRSVLPLNPRTTGRILLTGPAAEKTPVSGGGSAYVPGYDAVSYAAALRELGGSRVVVATAPSDVELKAADAVIVCPYIPETEGGDRSFELPAEQEALVKRAVALNPNTVVVVTQGGGIRMTGWADQANAIVFAYYPGQNGARALAQVLFGKANPGGKLPFGIEKEFADSPAIRTLPKFLVDNPTRTPLFNCGEEAKWELLKNGYAIPHTIVYKEGVFVGYRWYEHKKIETLFPFGHGLSYTTFEYGNLTVSVRKNSKTPRVDVAFDVRNTGRMAGAETAQVYVGDDKASVPRPPKELKAFKKVFLKPGQTQRLRFALDANAFAFWDPAARKWRVEPGAFHIHAGASSRDIRLRATCRVGTRA